MRDCPQVTKELPAKHQAALLRADGCLLMACWVAFSLHAYQTLLVLVYTRLTD